LVELLCNFQLLVTDYKLLVTYKFYMNLFSKTQFDADEKGYFGEFGG